MGVGVVPKRMEVDPRVERDPAADRLAGQMMERDDIMRTIVSETIESAANGDIREAGRTKCPEGGRIRGPLRRFERAIDLASCPLEKGGTWHTHVTPDEIQNPVNSLPDMANVIYGLTGVSIVVGTDTADVFVAPDDMEAGQRLFENALGIEMDGPRDLTQAIRDGRIQPTEGRRRVRDSLSELLDTHTTGYADLAEEIGRVEAHNWAAPFGSGGSEAFSGNRAAVPAMSTEAFKDAADGVESQIDNFGLGHMVVSTAVGTVVGGLVNRVVFGDD